jgi:hypothetical protein
MTSNGNISIKATKKAEKNTSEKED